MRKSTLIKFLLLALLISTAIVLFACYNPQGGGMLFTEVEGGYQIMGVSGKGRFYKNFVINIPSEYNEKPVVAIS